MEQQSLTEEGDAVPEGLDVQPATATTESVDLAQTSKQESLEVPVTDAPVPSEHDIETAQAETVQGSGEYDQGDEGLVEDSAVQEALHASLNGQGQQGECLIKFWRG